MSKKQIGKMEGSNLKGLDRLIGKDTPVEPNKTKDTREEELLTRTFNITQEDFDYLTRYTRYRTYVDNKRYTQREAIHEALELLKSKYKKVLE